MTLTPLEDNMPVIIIDDQRFAVNSAKGVKIFRKGSYQADVLIPLNATSLASVGDNLYIGNANGLHVWNIATNSLIRALPLIYVYLLTANSKYLVVSTIDTLYVYDTKTLNLLNTVIITEPFNSLIVEDDYLYQTSRTSGVRSYNLPQMEPVAELANNTLMAVNILLE
jgi:hypothetical protein